MGISLGGIAIWSMHFVGMKAMTLTESTGNAIDIEYRLDLTLVSLATVIIFCGLSLYISSADKSFTTVRYEVIDEQIGEIQKMSLADIKNLSKKQEQKSFMRKLLSIGIEFLEEERQQQEVSV
jgi:Bacterial signalling protein N terminal repeat